MARTRAAGAPSGEPGALHDPAWATGRRTARAAWSRLDDLSQGRSQHTPLLCGDRPRHRATILGLLARPRARPRRPRPERARVPGPFRLPAFGAGYGTEPGRRYRADAVVRACPLRVP